MKNYYKLENDAKLRNRIRTEEEFYQKATKIGETPFMNEDNIFSQILESHMAPKGKWGRVVVEEGHINYKWNDSDDIYVIDKENPLLIEPEREHKLILDGFVKVKVEFYKIEEEEKVSYTKNVLRPGENFL